MAAVTSWLETALRAEREELAVRHQELLSELQRLLKQAELRMDESGKNGEAEYGGQGGVQGEEEANGQEETENIGAREKDAELHAAMLPDPEECSRKRATSGAEFHVVRVQGQTKVTREGDEATARAARAYGSHFEKMGSRSGSGNLRVVKESRLYKFVTDPFFESMICAIIVVNTIIMSFEAQYAGLQLGYALGMRTYTMPADDVWPGASTMLEGSEWVFGSIFLIELILRVAGMGYIFFCDLWNWFDSITVLGWLVDTVIRGILPIDPMLLRLARLARLLRLMRLVRKLKGFDALYILTTALRGSVTVLLWSFLMLFLLQLIFALFLQKVAQDTIVFQTDVSFKDANEELFLYFGTCSRAVLTMFEITLGNWPPVARLLQDHVHEAFCVFSILHKITVGYALLAVINGVFLKETFSAAENDDKIMMRNTEKKRNQHIKKMQSLFEAADETGDGLLDKEEFIQVMSDPEIVNWLAAMDLQISDPNQLFEMVQHDGTISAPQLVGGVSRLKGAARSTDMHCVSAEVKQIHDDLKSVHAHLRAALFNGAAPNDLLPVQPVTRKESQRVPPLMTEI
ncbi:unnamed protein product [Effrenium voratum]|uniref:EF-hand domain-containing protein n=2 Tax=Effrenium voratum TaxID=2562239 RepID=A0AA36IMM1_9DINO|nr:unnamed protein product [Effrenium voratum]CAJ1427450.1 unnamed protein product [Effrenium voratum]